MQHYVVLHVGFSLERWLMGWQYVGGGGVLLRALLNLDPNSVSTYNKILVKFSQKQK